MTDDERNFLTRLREEDDSDVGRLGLVLVGRGGVFPDTRYRAEVTTGDADDRRLRVRLRTRPRVGSSAIHAVGVNPVINTARAPHSPSDVPVRARTDVRALRVMANPPIFTL